MQAGFARAGALLLAMVCDTRVAPAQPRPMTAADTLAIRSVGEVQISPDGSSILFTLTTSDLARNRTTTKLMRVPTAGGTPAEVPGALEGASSIRWAPDSIRVAFLARRDNLDAVWVLQLATGTLTRICDYDRGNSFLSKSGNVLSWSPAGTELAFVGTTEPEPPDPDPLVATRLQYKTRTSFSDNRRSHIYVVSADGGLPRAITAESYDEHSIDWGGDGSEIVFLSNREPDPDANHNYDIFAVDVASGAVRRLTDTPGVEMEPRVSPNGRFIAFTATTRRVTTIDSVAEDAHVWVMPAAGGAARELNRALDRRSSGPEWTPDSRAVIYTANDRGKTVIHRVPAEGGESTPLVDRRAQAGPVSVARQEHVVVFGMSDPAMPREIYRLARAGQPPVPLTALNAALVKSWRLTPQETVTFKSFDGTEVEGWLYPALDAAGKSPMILSVHGGPHGMYGYGFNPGFQLNAARGYATLALNPRGSSGYGQKFADGCVNNWGGGDYQDLMAGVDHVLRTRSTIDAERLGVTGGSYGGFMTNWIVTQTTRFKAAVSSASVSNLISFYATSLYQDLVHAEFDGFPWEKDNFSVLWKWSPLAHVKNAVTPTLLFHGERDHDVHITQAEEMFTALRRRGVEAVLVRYPREGHGLREPKHQLDRTVRTLEWFDRFLKPLAPTGIDD